MTDRIDDTELVRHAIRALRAADESVTPSFDTVRTRARGPRALAGMLLSRARLWAVAAGAVIVASGLYGLMKSRRPRLVVPQGVLALSSWRPATDVLLETPNRVMLRDAPRLSISLIDIPTSGDSR